MDNTKKQDIANELLEIFENNPIAWGKYYLEDHFSEKSADFHLKIMSSCLESKYLSIQAPRGSAKSTIAAFLYPFHQIIHKRCHFVVIVQNTFSKAKEILNSIKDELKDNESLVRDYGIKMKRDMEGDSIFVHRDGFSIRVLCKGAEQIGSVRGERFRSWRPDLIIVDDLEDDTMVKNPDRRIELQNEYDEALMPSVNPSKHQVIVIGTILHDDCLMAKLVSSDFYPEYRKLFYTARYENFVTHAQESLWPERWTVEDLNKLEKDKPDVFAKEYQGDPVSGSLKNFEDSDFRRWTIENGRYRLFDSEGKVTSDGLLSDCRAAIGCDLAWEEKKTADFTVVIPIFITPDSEILVDSYICKRGVRPDQFEEIIFNMEEKLRKATGKMVTVGFEKAKLEKVMKWFLGQAMRRRNHFITTKDIPWVSDKISRIVTVLQPRYKMGAVYHKQGMGDLEYQLKRLPSGKHDDLPDALQIAVRCLNFAPNKKTANKRDPDYDEGFEWLKSQLLDKKPKKYVFGKKKGFEVPFTETFL